MSAPGGSGLGGGVCSGECLPPGRPALRGGACSRGICSWEGGIPACTEAAPLPSSLGMTPPIWLFLDPLLTSQGKYNVICSWGFQNKFISLHLAHTSIHVPQRRPHLLKCGRNRLHDPCCKKRHKKKLVERILQKVMMTLQVQANSLQRPVYVLFALLFANFCSVWKRSSFITILWKGESTGKVGCSRKNTLESCHLGCVCLLLFPKLPRNWKTHYI